MACGQSWLDGGGGGVTQGHTDHALLCTGVGGGRGSAGEGLPGAPGRGQGSKLLPVVSTVAAGECRAQRPRLSSSANRCSLLRSGPGGWGGLGVGVGGGRRRLPRQPREGSQVRPSPRLWRQDDVSSQPWPDSLPVTLLPGWTTNLVLPGHSPFLSYLGR